MPELRVAIVGCGRMGRERARCANLWGARISHVMDPDRDRATLLARDHRSQVAEELAALHECDAVFLCTPPGMRTTHARWAVEAGVPFFAEKPVALGQMEADDVAVMLAERPVVNAVGYMNRWRSSVRYVKELLDTRHILGLTAHWANRPYQVPWWLDEHCSGGPLNEQATHLFDLARFLCGEIVQAHPVGSPRLAGAMATTVATTLTFASGAVGTILYSCEASAKDIGLRIVATNGSIAFSTWAFSLTENTIEDPPPVLPTEDIFLVETGAFLDSVRTGDGSGLLSDWHDANRTQRVMNGIRKDLAR